MAHLKVGQDMSMRTAYSLLRECTMNDSNKLFIKHQDAAKINEKDYEVDPDEFLDKMTKCNCCMRDDVPRVERHLGKAVIAIEDNGDVTRYYMCCSNCKNVGRLL